MSTPIAINECKAEQPAQPATKKRKAEDAAQPSRKKACISDAKAKQFFTKVGRALRYSRSIGDDMDLRTIFMEGSNGADTAVTSESIDKSAAQACDKLGGWTRALVGRYAMGDLSDAAERIFKDEGDDPCTGHIFGVYSDGAVANIVRDKGFSLRTPGEPLDTTEWHEEMQYMLDNMKLGAWEKHFLKAAKQAKKALGLK
jgi:hypothetical protein